MKNIYDIDRNFQTEAVRRSDLRLHSVREECFSLHGLYEPRAQGLFRRMPEEVARNTSEGVAWLHTNTAGGRVRFRTDSEYVALRAILPQVCVMDHMPLTGICGFDLYVGDRFYGTFRPKLIQKDNTVEIPLNYEGIFEFGSCELRDITIHFPLYNDVEEVVLGLQEDAVIAPPSDYTPALPIVFYGSSITQGGCASRPGNSYEAVLSRRLNADFINLGFSGNARGEETIARYIASLPMSAFVYDYDYNAPDAEHLQNTHEAMFRIIREAQPDLPVVFVSSPTPIGTRENSELRMSIVRKTCENALSRGDMNVAFVNGLSIPREDAEMFSVDGVHPNDYGFFCMANALEPILKKFLQK